MTTYNTSDFQKGLKVQIDGVPYLMVEMNFRKPGKGNALYECKMKNLVRGTMLDRTYRAGQTLEGADVSEFEAQYLYRQGESFVFMDNDDYEQYELSAEQVGDTWKFLKEGMACTLMVWDNKPIGVTPPNHVILKVEYAEAGRPRQHGHERAEAGQAGNGRRDRGAGVRQHGRLPAHRHPHRRIHRTGQGTGSMSSCDVFHRLTYSTYSPTHSFLSREL